MVRTTEELATKLVYLKDNNYMPNIDDETPEVQNAIQSFYFCSKSVSRDTNKIKDNDFWFKMTFCNYMVTDEFVRDVNREFKRFKLLNIGKNEY